LLSIRQWFYSCGPPADAGKEAVRYQTESKHGHVVYKPNEEAKELPDLVR